MGVCHKKCRLNFTTVWYGLSVTVLLFGTLWSINLCKIELVDGKYTLNAVVNEDMELTLPIINFVSVATVVLMVSRMFEGKLPSDLCGFKGVTYQNPLNGSDPEVFPGEDNLVLCEDYECVQISYCRLEKMFPGVFLTENEYLQKLSYPACRSPDVGGVTKRQVGQCATDGDLCCPTQRYYTHHSLTSLTNINGEWCYIFQLSSTPGQYQWFTEGVCGGPQDCTNGQCEIEQVSLTLLGWCTVSGTAFHHFDIDGYCSCKNIGG